MNLRKTIHGQSQAYAIEDTSVEKRRGLEQATGEVEEVD